MAIGSKGRRWEILHSFWLIWALIPTFAWVGFLWIGFRGRNRQWLVWAGAYFILFLGIWIPIAIVDSNKDKAWSSLLGLLLLFGWLVGIGHLIYLRREYLLRLAALQPIEASEQRTEVANIREDYGDPQAEARVRALFEQCNALVLEIDGQLTLEARSRPSALRTQYADALAARAEGERLLDTARAPHEFHQAEIPLRRALDGLQQVKQALGVTASQQ
jgi:hypothetical protein